MRNLRRFGGDGVHNSRVAQDESYTEEVGAGGTQARLFQSFGRPETTDDTLQQELSQSQANSTARPMSRVDSGAGSPSTSRVMNNGRNV